MFPNSCPFQKSPLHKKPLFSSAKRSVVFFLDSMVRLSVLAQILPGCGSATSVASRCKIVNETSGLIVAEGELLKNLCFMSYLANLFYLLQEYEFTIIIINLLTRSNQSKCLYFYQDVLRDLYANGCDPRLPTPSNPCIPAELHSSSPSGNLGNFGSWKKTKNPMYVYAFFQVSTLIRGETTDCHSHPRKGVGFFP